MKFHPSHFVRSLLCSVAFVTAARAADALDTDPAPELVATSNAVINMVSGKTPDQVTAEINQIRDTLSADVALPAVVQRCFGRNWSKLTQDQQTEAIDLLGRLIIRTYATQLATGEKPRITVVSSRVIAPSRREVVTAVDDNGRHVTVIYRLAPIDGKWKIYDVLAENISLVGNYRQQFDAHFENKNAEDLLKILREKLAAPVVAPPPPAARS
jgi:phospholipid transport system substrate-binding protein